MFCTNCGNDLSGLENAHFCNNCGAPKVPIAPDGPAQKRTRRITPRSISKNAKSALGFLPKLMNHLRLLVSRLTKKQRIITIASAVVIPLLAVASLVAIDAYRIDESDKNVTLSEIVSTDQYEQLEKAVCGKLEQLMFDADEQTTYSSRMKALESVIARVDKRYPPIYARNNLWTSERIRDVSEAVDDLLSPELKSILSANPRVDSKIVAPLVFRFTTEFTDNTLAGCGLTTAYSVSDRLASDYNSTQTRFQSAVDSAPWYPAGYTEATWASGSDKIAYKWVERGHDCYSCYQWDINVISKDGCPSSLYAKVNIEKGGVAIGWTNDTLGSLDAGQVGQMRFQFYGDGYGTLTASIEEFSCY